MEIYKITLIRNKDNLRKEFAIPGDMPLWAINYLISKSFDISVDEPSSFNLLEEDFKVLAGKITKDWKKYLGIWFMSPYRSHNEDDWYVDTDIDNKIKGPYKYNGHFQTIYDWKEDLDDFVSEYADLVIVSNQRNEYGYYSVRPIMDFEEYDEDNYTAYPFDDLPLKFLPYLFDNNIDDLVITLTIEEIYKKYHRIIMRDGYNHEFMTILIDDDKDISLEMKNIVQNSYTPKEIINTKNKV